jgi:hypothetical protein
MSLEPSLTDISHRQAVGGRDLRVDFFRGLALWMIFVDHIHGNFWKKLTYQNVGLSDAAEIFIFLSGISCAFAYGRILQRDGWATAQKKATRRAARVYLGYLAATVAFFVVALAAAPFLTVEAIDVLDLAPLLQDPLRAGAAALDLRFAPYTLMVLPVYVVLIPFAGVALGCISRRPVATVAASASLWALVQAAPSVNLPSILPGGVWPINPLAWQLLFVIGLAAGWRHYQKGAPFVATRPAVALAVIVALLGLAVRLAHAMAARRGWQVPLLDELVDASLGWPAKTDLSPLRLIHFLAVAYLVASLVAGRRKLFHARWARPLVVSGQHSLALFCLSIVLNLGASLWVMLASPGRAMQLAITVAGCLALWTCAVLLDGRKERRGTGAPALLLARTP